MNETKLHLLAEAVGDVRIVSLNRDKTRILNLTDSTYQVYFELSEAPSHAWRNSFAQEWKALTPAQPAMWEKANVDGRFLVVHCALNEVGSTHLPMLKKAVDATNIAHKKVVAVQATEHDRQVDIWKLERKSVDEMAETLRFD